MSSRADIQKTIKVPMGQGSYKTSTSLVFTHWGLEIEVIVSLAFNSEDSRIQASLRAPDHEARESRGVLRWLS